MKEQQPNRFTYVYERLPEFLGKDKKLARKLSNIPDQPKLGSTTKEQFYLINQKQNDKIFYTGRRFKLIKTRKNYFDKEDLVSYKKNSFYVRVRSDYETGDIVIRELWVLHEDNK